MKFFFTLLVVTLLLIACDNQRKECFDNCDAHYRACMDFGLVSGSLDAPKECQEQKSVCYMGCNR